MKIVMHNILNRLKDTLTSRGATKGGKLGRFKEPTHFWGSQILVLLVVTVLVM